MPKNQINIPTVTNLVASGDPRLKARAQDSYASPSYIDELNVRIDELENAIGQDNNGPIGRAFAIRAENKEPTINTSSLIDEDAPEINNNSNKEENSFH